MPGGKIGYIVRAIYPPFFWGALLRVMGAPGGPLVLLQVKKGAFITARELYHRNVWTDLFTQQMLLERDPESFERARPDARQIGMLERFCLDIIANVSFDTPNF